MARPTSLKFKLAFFATLLVVFVASSLSTYIRSGQKKAIIEGQATNREDTVKALRQVAREALLVNDDTDMVNYVNLLKRSFTTAYAMVIDKEGNVLVHTDPLMLKNDRPLDDPAAREALAYRSPHAPLVQNVKDAEGRDVIDLSLPVFIGNEWNGAARIGFDKPAFDKIVAASMKEVDRRIVGAFLLALVLGIIGAILLTTFITRPLEVVRQGAVKIGEGKLEHRIEVNTRDELKDLADEFNLMAQKLGELDRMKQDFVSNVTHELRSPMTSIRGYIDLLLQGAAGPVSELQKDYLSVIKNSAVRLGRFIDNLLDVAKIEAHKLKLSPEAQALHPLAHEMEVLFKPQLDEKKITLVNAVPKNGSLAFVDKDKLAEVLINLTSNAIKFTPEKGTIRLSATEGTDHFEMVVEDSGVGIPAEMVGKLFNKFEQVKSGAGSLKAQKGTGLGLAIAKGIVEAHGGKIWIVSPAAGGKGTAFHFTVPKLTEELKGKLERT